LGATILEGFVFKKIWGEPFGGNSEKFEMKKSKMMRDIFRIPEKQF
jgi:hypothetical protein